MPGCRGHRRSVREDPRLTEQGRRGEAADVGGNCGRPPQSGRNRSLSVFRVRHRPDGIGAPDRKPGPAPAPSSADCQISITQASRGCFFFGTVWTHGASGMREIVPFEGQTWLMPSVDVDNAPRRGGLDAS